MDFDSKYGVGQCIVNELCNINLKNDDVKNIQNRNSI